MSGSKHLRTTPPGRYILLYDGLCRFCEAGATRLVSLAKRDAIAKVNFQEPGVLGQFPGISHEMCKKQMYLISPTGNVIGGFEAAVQAIATRPLIRWIAYVYYVPGLRWLLDALYAFIARNRYRIMGKMNPHDCAGGACALHFPARQVTK